MTVEMPRMEHTYELGGPKEPVPTLDDLGNVGEIIAGILQGFESTFHQYRAGLLSYELWDNCRTRLRWYVTREGARSWLKLSGHTWASPEFGAIVNDLVSESE